MIAITDHTDYWITSSYPTGGYLMADDLDYFIETITEASLRILKEQRFIPRKIGLENNSKVQKKMIRIRNQLPYKLRFD